MPQKRLNPLDAVELRKALERLPGWSGNENGLEKTITFGDFRQAMRFMQACVEGIEERDHHPVWCNKYNSLEIHLDTFDAGHRVTERDVDLAEFLESMLLAQANKKVQS